MVALCSSKNNHSFIHSFIRYLLRESQVVCTGDRVSRSSQTVGLNIIIWKEHWSLCLTPTASDSVSLGRGWEFSFVTISQVMLMLLTGGPPWASRQWKIKHRQVRTDKEGCSSSTFWLVEIPCWRCCPLRQGLGRFILGQFYTELGMEMQQFQGGPPFNPVLPPKFSSK